MMEKHDNELTFVLHDVARLMHVRFDQHARTWGMTRAQCVILIKVRCRPGLSQSELATLMEVEPISVVRLIDRLEAAGMVERRPDPSDRRMHRLHLLPAAEPALAKIDAFRAAAAEKFRQGIPGEDWDTALRVLMQIKDQMASEAMEDALATAGE
jgi:DNA-binding MarR family transcriptional regulator